MPFCSECGTQNPNDANFCTSCGNRLNSATGTSDGQPQVVHQPQASSSQHHSNTYAVLGWICNAIALLLVPILFGAGGVVFGYLHRKVDHTHGTIIMIFGVACGILGVFIGMAAY